MTQRIELIGLLDFPLVEPGDDLAGLIMASFAKSGDRFRDGDVVVLAQKIVSKAENRYAYLKDVEPSDAAIKLAKATDKDPRIVELILTESEKVVRHRVGAIIVRHRLGYVHANAGIDQSNISSGPDNERVLLLPSDPDKSAAELRNRLKAETGADTGVIINDSAGRPWRDGIVGFAIGTAGFEPLVSMIGHADLFGRPLQITKVAVADELSAAASFLMGQADEAMPVVVIRGAKLRRAECGSGRLIRLREEDLFR